MCRQATCLDCRKPTWAGCGAHVEDVLGDVTESERCDCGVAGEQASGLIARMSGAK